MNDYRRNYHLSYTMSKYKKPVELSIPDSY